MVARAAPAAGPGLLRHAWPAWTVVIAAHGCVQRLLLLGMPSVLLAASADFLNATTGGKRKTQVDLTHLERLHRRRVPRGDGLEPLLAREARRGRGRRVAPGRAEVRLARGRVGDVGQDRVRLRQLLP